jgi:hypothetical protein
MRATLGYVGFAGHHFGFGLRLKNSRDVFGCVILPREMSDDVVRGFGLERRPATQGGFFAPFGLGTVVGASFGGMRTPGDGLTPGGRTDAFIFLSRVRRENVRKGPTLFRLTSFLP